MVLTDEHSVRVMSFNIRFDNVEDGENRWAKREMVASGMDYGFTGEQEDSATGLLSGILNSNSTPIAERAGNSLQDFRLSVKGWLFGHHIAAQVISTSVQAVGWLESNLSR